MNQKFLEGFVKQAEAEGFSREYACALAKEAGFWSGVGNMANDMFVKPATGIFRDGGRTITALGNGDFTGAAKAFGSTLGNAALTGMNFIPGAGLGGMAVRGGLRAGQMALRAGGSGMLRAGVGAAGRSGMLGRVAEPLWNAGMKMQGGGVKALQNAGTRFGNFQQAAGQKIMGLADRGVNKMQGFGRQLSDAYGVGRNGPAHMLNGPGRAPLSQTPVSNFMARNTAAPGTAAKDMTSGQRWMGRAQAVAPGAAGTLGFMGNSGQRQEQQNGNPYGTYDDYLY